MHGKNSKYDNIPGLVLAGAPGSADAFANLVGIGGEMPAAFPAVDLRAIFAIAIDVVFAVSVAKALIIVRLL